MWLRDIFICSLYIIDNLKIIAQYLFVLINLTLHHDNTGAISRCFGSFLDPNSFQDENERLQLGKSGQVFFYYYFVNNNDLSVGM